MKFAQAYEALKQGAKVKLPEWAGFWAWEHDTIKMHCKDGRILDIRETEDVDYTLRLILRGDWEIIDGEVAALNIETFTFGEAIRRLKLGQKVARKGWNGKGMFLYLTEGSVVRFNSLRGNAAKHVNAGNTGRDDACINAHIDMKAADGTIVVGWLASQTDMLALDWVAVD